MQTLLDFVDASFCLYLDTNAKAHLVVYVLIRTTCLEGNIHIFFSKYIWQKIYKGVIYEQCRYNL